MSERIESASIGVAVTPSDSTNFANGICRSLYIGGAGVVVAVMNGTAVTFAAVPAGTNLRIQASRVNSTNTTATNIVALY